jgi:hypothetical protein
MNETKGLNFQDHSFFSIKGSLPFPAKGQGEVFFRKFGDIERARSTQ